MEAKRCLSCGAGLPASGLVCSFCGAAHVMTGPGLGLACPGCGAGNRPDARACVGCRQELVIACPECRARSPIGGRFCQECRIEFAGYKRARAARVPSRFAPADAERQALEHLSSGWFGPGDVKTKARIVERVLAWVPVWRFRARAVGEVEGQVAHTHYRTTTSREFDHHRNEWVDKADSEPYQVWEHVRKSVDQPLDVIEPASQAGRPLLADIVDDSAWLVSEAMGFGALLRGPGELLRRIAGRKAAADRTEPVEPAALATEPWERAFDPDRDDAGAYDRLRRAALDGLRASVLDKVERLDVRVLEPSLTLVYHPVWRVVWRYGRRHGEVRLHGSTGEATGDKPGLLDRWFS